MKYHSPVLLNEILESLKVSKGKKYIDCTLGDGGYTQAILERGGIVLGIDIDPQAVERASGRLKDQNYYQNLVLVMGNFKNIEKIASENDFTQVSGIVYDLGYSSYQLDDRDKGLSFLQTAPLDMRLDPEITVTAADLVNGLRENELKDLIINYSDERYAGRFSKAIVKNRNLKKIQTTKDLADILVSASPPGYENGRIHPATRTFQALRIAVNSEIDNLKESLPQAARLLLPEGRMLVVSFHSLEDRTVKQFGQSAQPCISGGLRVINKKPIQPSETEIENNIRSRSAKLRVFEKC